jgi:hypothetical protein
MRRALLPALLTFLWIAHAVTPIAHSFASPFSESSLARPLAVGALLALAYMNWLSLQFFYTP